MSRTHEFKRKTKETDIKGKLHLEGSGKTSIQTGIGFLDHMLDLLAFHSGFNLDLTCKGDLEVCAHHSIEDIALAIGEAFITALGDKKGIKRYAHCYLPMDETLSRTVIDISGRPYHVFKGEFSTENIGTLPTEMIKHFFYSFSAATKITLHQEILYGDNDHHKAESLFKGLGKCLVQAIDIVSDKIPSSKGML
jgi:imidazoleglycerol-phosphate dehydratase